MIGTETILYSYALLICLEYGSAIGRATALPSFAGVAEHTHSREDNAHPLDALPVRVVLVIANGGTVKSRLTKVASGLMGAALCATLIGTGARPAPVAANSDLNLPWYVELVQNADSTSWDRTPASQIKGTVSVVVHVNKSPLAMVGRNWTHQQRVDYVKQIRAEQDKIVPQITKLGGKIVGRFAQVSAGLAVQIDASKLDGLRQIAGVIGVQNIRDYETSLEETVPLINADDLRNMGVTGQHNDGEGIDVAVIDSGIDYTHKKLGGPGTLEAYALAYCGDEDAIPDPTDPSCNANATTDVSGYFPNDKVVGGFDWVGEEWPNGDILPDDNPIDFEGHGTHVADIIGGLPSSTGGSDFGVAPGVDIWGFKACSAVASSCNGLAILLSIDDALDLDDSDYGACDPDTDADCKTYDPADVINMSLGAAYGQPEEDSTFFVDIATYYGSVVVVSAGNSGDRPYIVGSPSAAAGSLSVAQSSVPSESLYRITAGSVSAGGSLQPWSPAPTGTLSGVLQYGNGAGGNLLGCNAFPAGSLTGKVLLVDRGTCAISIKGANGSAAGAAFVIVANNSFSNTPPTFSYGGGNVTVPTFTVTQNDGAKLKTVLGSTASVSNNSKISLVDDIVASSSRGPRIADGDIKPDIAAPGASISAEVGTGTDKTAFGGTSGAAPMVSGAAALIVESLEERGILQDAEPGVNQPGQSIVPLVKAMLMNTANPNVYIGGSAANGGSGFLAPITLTGAGRVDALAAYKTNTVALDVTDYYNWMIDPNRDDPCPVTTPPTAVARAFGFYTDEAAESYACLSAYPYGNDYFNAFNGATGSISFGYDGVSGTTTETRKVLVANLGNASQTYKLISAFRYNDDKNKGVSVAFSPSSVTVPAGEQAMVDVKITIKASGLRDWTLDSGKFGASGTNIYCNDPNPQFGCPTLTMFEYDGFITIKGSNSVNTVRMPWQALPKKAAKTSVASSNNSRVVLRNTAASKPGDTDVFALMEVSPNQCDLFNPDNGDCVEENYVPGIVPALNASPIDIKETGVRSYSVPGLDAALGFPEAPEGSIGDQVIDFAVTVYDAPFRASHNYPVEFDIYVDNNNDGVDDYVVFNADQALNATDGRNAVFVADVNPADGTRALRPYFFSFTDFNSQNWILPVPAGAVGVTSNQPFSFYVLAFDAYFGGPAYDISPVDGTAHQFTLAQPKYQPATSSLQVPTRGSFTLNYIRPAGGAAASPSQDGFLFLYRDAEVGRESDARVLP